MKKKLFLTTFAIAFLLTACGTDEVMESTSTPTTETISESTETIVETISTPETTAPLSTWLTDNNISITPQGDFFQPSNLYNANTYELLDFVQAQAQISIIETTEDAPEGYKRVIATKTVDGAYADEYDCNTALKAWFSAFDRYTGYSFEATTGTGSRENSFLISANGKEYDISLQFSTSGPTNNTTSIIEITCPIDYDGAVFQVGPATLNDELTWMLLDTSERLYTIDEFPFFGDNYLYFTYTDQ